MNYFEELLYSVLHKPCSVIFIVFDGLSVSMYLCRPPACPVLGLNCYLYERLVFLDPPAVSLRRSCLGVRYSSSSSSMEINSLETWLGLAVEMDLTKGLGMGLSSFFCE